MNEAKEFSFRTCCFLFLSTYYSRFKDHKEELKRKSFYFLFLNVQCVCSLLYYGISKEDFFVMVRKIYRSANDDENIRKCLLNFFEEKKD